MSWNCYSGKNGLCMCLGGKKKEGKGSLTYDVQFKDTDLTECTKPPQAAYNNLLLSNRRALNEKMVGGRKISCYKLLDSTTCLETRRTRV